MAMGTSAGTTKDKLKDMLETQRMLIALIRHYTFVLENNDEIMATFDADIATIEGRKLIAKADFEKAPQELTDLNTQLLDLQTKHKSLKDLTSGKTQRINKFRALRDRLRILKAELEAEGLDPDSGERQ